jgi:hypothetical protein
MTTMLEKAAIGLSASMDPHQPWDAVPEHLKDALRTHARAALLAIREPDDVVLGAMDAGLDFTNNDGPSLLAGEWRSAIDAILNEKPETAT